MKRMAGRVVVGLCSLGREKGSWAKEKPQQVALASDRHCCVYGRRGGWALSKWQAWSASVDVCSVPHWDAMTHWGCGGRVSDSGWCIVCEHSPPKQRHKAPMHWQLKHLSFCPLLGPGWNDHRPLQVESKRRNIAEVSHLCWCTSHTGI